jgi:CopG family nickel-responsive transcriptional regulator
MCAEPSSTEESTMSKEPVSRISISLPSTLLHRFDEHSHRLSYTNRSKAIQDAMQHLITESKWLCKQQGTGVGAITMVYDHHAMRLEDTLTEIQHRFHTVIYSSMHVHLDGNNCLEIIAVRGPTNDVRDLTVALQTQKGVKQLKLTIITP